MFLRHTIVVILLLWSFSSISPHAQRWLRKQLKKLNKKIDVIDTNVKDIKEEIGKMYTFFSDLKSF